MSVAVYDLVAYKIPVSLNILFENIPYLLFYVKRL